MSKARVILGLSLTAALTVACSSQVGAPRQAPTSSVAAATATPAPPATAEPVLSKELQVLGLVPPTVDAMVAAIEDGDLPAALAAYEAYDAAWNGTEVYINFRSKDAYDKLEGELQHEIEEGLAAAQPDFKALEETAEELAAEWVKTLDMVEAGGPIHPLFDDVATIRMIRTDMRIVTSALAAGDVAKAKSHWTAFTGRIGPAKDLIGIRTPAGLAELDAALSAADAGFKDAAATADQLKPLAAAVSASYNFGLSLWNAAARNADASKTTWSEDDLASLAALKDVSNALTGSLTSWQAGDYSAAGTAAATASSAFAAIQPKLAAHNGADVALQTALGAYAEVAGAAGDATAVAAANKAAQNALLVAQQVFVGQFWTDKALQDKISALPMS
jgi:hypothetical protein